MNQPIVYVGAEQRKSRDSVEQGKSRDSFVYALEANTGSALWRYALHDSASSHPVAKADGIYFSTSNGHVQALHPGDGSLLWRQKVDHEFPSPPASADGLIYITTNQTMYALQATDGSIRWQHPLNDLWPRQPVIADGRVYVMAKNGLISVLDANNGSLLWQLPDKEGKLRQLTAGREVVYCAGPGSNLSTYRSSDGSLLWQQPMRYSSLLGPLIANDMLYLNAMDSLQARLASDGSLRWSTRAHGGHRSLAARNHLLFTSQGRGTTAEVSALRLSDGSPVWKWHTSMEDGGVTGPVATNEAVYVGVGASGGLYAFSANDGSVLWHALNGMSVSTVATGENTQ